MAHTHTDTARVTDPARVTVTDATADVARHTAARARARAARERAADRRTVAATAADAARVAAAARIAADPDPDTDPDAYPSQLFAAARLAASVADGTVTDADGHTLADRLADAVTRARAAHGTTDATARARARAAASVRRAIADVATDTAARVGRTRYTSANVADVGTAAASVADRFALDGRLADTVADDIAAYIGRPGTDPDTVRRFTLADGPSAYAARLARRAARSRARHTGTGSGSMPRLTVSVAAIRERMTDVYGSAAWTVMGGTGPCNGDGPGCPDGHVFRRDMTDPEVTALLRVARWERVERSPLFARFMDGHGHTVPDAATGHTLAHVAPDVPERDALPVARGTLADRLAHTGTDPDTVRAALAALARVNMYTVAADGSHVYPARVPWRTVAADVYPDGGGCHPGTLARRVAAALARVADAVTVHGPDAGYVPDAALPVARDTVTRAARFAPSRVRVTLARRTGHTVHDGTHTADGIAVAAPIAPYAWRTVGRHVPRVTGTDGTVIVPGCIRGGTCADGCRALALLPVRQTVTDTDTVTDATADGTRCTDPAHADGCPRTCPVRAARRTRIARGYARRLANV